METQTRLNISDPVDSVEAYEFEPIQGYPMLNWKGKRPFQSTQYYAAQLKETHGKEVEGWLNKIYWGDNLQVMSHLLKTYRGKITLIYIDPPFDSKADYKMQIEAEGQRVENDRTPFEEKQYRDIWANDEYLQFMHERLILMRELLSDNGSIYLHCDPTMGHYLRMLMDEVFGKDHFRNEIIWFYHDSPGRPDRYFPQKHDIIIWYSKDSTKWIFNSDKVRVPILEASKERYKSPRIIGGRSYVGGESASEGKIPEDVWSIPVVKKNSKQGFDYPTQKPEALLERIIKASSNSGDLVFDCFMGSGTTQAVAMKLGRRFIGADINLGAVEITTKRLLKVAAEVQGNADQAEINLEAEEAEETTTSYTGFEVYNVNNYEVFRNPVEAKALLIEHFEIQPLPTGGIYDGEKDGRMVKIMPVNRIATRADLNELIYGFDRRAFERRQEEHPTVPVEKLSLICMGHEPDLAAALQNEVPYKLDIEVKDILLDKSIQFKRKAEAKIVRRDGHLIIEQFYPMNLLQKLSWMEENVEDWRELVESVKVDFNYDGAVLNPSVADIPEEDELVKGSYPIPEDAGTIRVKITDLLSESLEETVE